MPNRTDPSRPAQQAGADQENLGQEGRNNETECEAGLPRGAGAAHDRAGSQAQPGQGRLTLTTPPADHRMMKGRY